MHRCTKCGETKDATEYAPSRLRNRAYICRPCDTALGAARRRSPKGKAYFRNYHLQRSFGITAEDFDALLAQQHGVCAICGEIQTSRALDVDHCHASGRVRGLLCAKCNKMIGLANDSHIILNLAAAYLVSHGIICNNDAHQENA